MIGPTYYPGPGGWEGIGQAMLILLIIWVIVKYGGIDIQ